MRPADQHAARDQPRRIVLSPRLAAAGLAASILMLLLLHGASQVARFGYGRGTLRGFSSRVYFGAEASIPAWFSSALLLICGGLLLWIAAEHRRRRQRGVGTWATLGVLFVALSMDEAAALHEAVSPMFTGLVELLAGAFGGIFVPLARKPGYAWAVPALLLVVALGVACVSFLRRLPPASRRLFVLAAGIYVGGAIGVELAGGRYSGEFGADNVAFVLVLTLEETLEMAGLAVFVYALLAYAEREFGVLELAIGERRGGAGSAAGTTAPGDQCDERASGAAPNST